MARPVLIGVLVSSMKFARGYCECSVRILDFASKSEQTRMVRPGLLKSELTVFDSLFAGFKAAALTSEQIAKLKETFSLLDKDGDGCITARELGVYLRSLGQNPTEAELQDMIDEIDADGNGAVDFAEFLSAAACEAEEEELAEKEAYPESNKDGDDSSSAAQLRTYIASWDEKAPEEELDEVFQKEDQGNHEG